MFKTKLATAVQTTVQPHCLTLALLASTPVFAATEVNQSSNDEAQEVIQVIGVKQSLTTNVAQSTMRSEADLSTVPRSVQVINTEVIEQQDIQSLSDALYNVSNVAEHNNYGGTRDQFKIRSFDANAYEDGTRIYGLAQDKAVIDDLEFIEVVKGPESVLYGNMSPGGLVNLITKRPQAVANHQVKATLDEHGKQKFSLDFTGPANEDETILYRLVGVFDDSEGWRDHSGSKQTFIAPSVTWLATEDTAVTFAYKYNKEEMPFDRGTLAVRNASNTGWEFLDIDEKRLGATFSNQERETHKYSLELEHAINYNWTTRFKARYQERTYKGDRVHFYAASPITTPPAQGNLTLYIEDRATNAFDGTIARYIASSNESSETTLYSWENVFDVETEDFAHRIIAGADYTSYESKTKTMASSSWSDPDLVGYSALIQRTVNPNSGVYNYYNDAPSTATHPNDTYNVNTDTFELKEYSIFLQDLVEYHDWNFVLGARYDIFDAESSKTWDSTVQQGAARLNVTLQNSNSDSPKEKNLSLQAGALYALNDQVSLFGNFTNSYLPNQKYDTVKNEWVDSQRGTQYEFGTKTSLLDSRLNLTAAIFHIDLENVAYQGDVPGSYDVYKQRSQGFEVDGDFAITRKLMALFAYGYNDVEFVNSPSSVNKPVNVPEHNASLWLSYQATQEWGVGSGVRYVGDRAGNRREAYDYTLPAYTLIDMAAWYTPDFADQDLRLQLNVKNVFDEEYYSAGSDSTQNAVYLGSPRTISLTAAYNF
ncbi:TonB-dependent siderophore receptor [Vibrio harveyi]|uniref:TonB-dependent siderophore receptor n=1 Tax=Vibrio harveyi TaxID=669 RepID=UPI000682EE69|nr:TonB-dependent siderophore receptor [Vibrio harveyi]